jgi:prevent-host-death family protein
MTMKEVVMSAARCHRRVGVAEAKARFSEVLRDTAKGPTLIHSRGRDLAVLIAIEDYEQLVKDQLHRPATGSAFSVGSTRSSAGTAAGSTTSSLRR